MNEFHNADCMNKKNGLPSYKDKHFDLAIVDPDFGLNDKISSGGTWASKYVGGDGFLDGKPDKNYFLELFRISKNQVVWGGNYFIDMLYPTRCILVWDKIAEMETLADFEIAWTSFDSNSKIYRHPRNTTETRIHICQKPIALYKWLLTKYAKQGDLILDTHVGSASSLIACEDMGFKYVAFELDTDYYNAVQKRLVQYRSQMKLEL